MAFFRSAPDLEIVDIALIPFVRVKRLTKVSDQFLLFFSTLACPKLKEVNVAGHADLTDFGVTARFRLAIDMVAYAGEAQSVTELGNTLVDLNVTGVSLRLPIFPPAD